MNVLKYTPGAVAAIAAESKKSEYPPPARVDAMHDIGQTDLSGTGGVLRIGAADIVWYILHQPCPEYGGFHPMGESICILKPLNQQGFLCFPLHYVGIRGCTEPRDLVAY